MKTKRKLIRSLCVMLCVAGVLAWTTSCSSGSVSPEAGGARKAANAGSPGTQSSESGTTAQRTKEVAGNPGKKGEVAIGVILLDQRDRFLTYLAQNMKREAQAEPGTSLEIKYSGDDAERQSEQVEELLAAGVSAIVFIPVNAEQSVKLTKRIQDAGIPAIILSRAYEGVEGATAYVGSERPPSAESPPDAAGILEMDEIAKLLGGKGNIALIDGGKDEKRAEDIKHVIAQHPGLNLVFEGSAAHDRYKALLLMSDWLTTGKSIDAVVATNDEMAIGAILAARLQGKEKGMRFAGVDGTMQALEMMKMGNIDVTVFQDAAEQGKQAIKVAVKAAQGLSFTKNTYVPYELVTANQADRYIAKWNQ
ncbi:inositol transport system substrate-binding protein [Paenibacillus sophorae]|uniref:Inositol transport system substrate-binding protein n=1 Tax=Paenibacillus sophorae TaxID=1333845 RepID=A0A1H8U4E2_9BACL|nr:sugar ABC transporter substrate-binding protein [Paenibacillus sophorae]QWU17943.1 sugar ABC transporter substrate-binding protein [Paenibacillus sophorae]SEO98140.1 inositol transport system substrate-binding protein [Paenibacillus sophorae]